MGGLRVVTDGFGLGESPRWHEGRLWFSDWIGRQVLAVDGHGVSEVVAELPSMPFCFDALPDGRVLIVSGGEGVLLRREADGSLVTHADLTGLCAPPWNDIVVDGRGNAYVGATGFDFPGGEFAPGILALVGPDGAAREVADGLAFVNGLAVTPDNRRLIAAESYGNCLTAFTIGEDGGLSDRRVWADLGEGVPDGICIDGEGAVWYADVPNQRCVRVREGGEVLQTIDVDRGCFACMLGGPHGRTLYIVAADWRGLDSTGVGEPTGRLLAVPAPAPGAGWPGR